MGLSFGATRELAFRHAKTGELFYVPQTNGMMFYFGRDVNITWQHGVNALPDKEQDGKGRISVVCWGYCNCCFEEANSPPMLTDDSRGTFSMSDKGKGKGKGGGKGDGKGAVTFNVVPVPTATAANSVTRDEDVHPHGDGVC